MSVIFSPTTVAFYPVELQADYVAAGSWPADGVEISDQVWETFKGSPPDGKIRGAVDGAPAWVDAPPPSPQPIITATAFLNRFTQVE
ncbi:MAG: hypothetical protein P4L71_17235, partial [Acetobacteraceae bacterium]|nr:hypothetical protein [Acetobacteraceae bacterium]